MQSKRVLLVDDNELVLTVTARCLRQLSCEVTAVNDPAEALFRVLGGERFDVLVSDLEMPVLDGLELVAEIARAGVRLPSLIVSAAPDLASRMPSGQRWLEKPATTEDFARELALAQG